MNVKYKSDCLHSTVYQYVNKLAGHNVSDYFNYFYDEVKILYLSEIVVNEDYCM